MSPFPPSDLVALSAEEIVSEALDGWALVDGRLQARYRTGSFAAGVAFVVRIGEVADAADHHPDVDLRYPHVTIAMNSHDVDAITARDVRLARAITAIAADLGAPIDTR